MSDIAPGVRVLVMPNPSPWRAGTIAWVLRKDMGGMFYGTALQGNLTNQDRYVLTCDPLGQRTDCVFSLPRQYFEPVYWRDLNKTDGTHYLDQSLFVRDSMKMLYLGNTEQGHARFLLK